MNGCLLPRVIHCYRPGNAHVEVDAHFLSRKYVKIGLEFSTGNSHSSVAHFIKAAYAMISDAAELAVDRPPLVQRPDNNII